MELVEDLVAATACRVWHRPCGDQQLGEAAEDRSCQLAGHQSLSTGTSSFTSSVYLTISFLSN
jgi:hypothetical protein